MKHSLQLKVGQNLSMTPQLQQAIKLLQLSSLELQTEIQEALDSNPLLEIADDEDPSEESSQSIEQKESSRLDEPPPQLDNETPFDQSQTEESWSTDDIPEHLSTDSQWDDTFQSSSSTNRDDDWMPGDNDAAAETIQDHLNWQLNLVNFSDVDRYIAEMIIDSIDDRGYLVTDLQEILFSCQEELPGSFLDVELDEVEAVLHRIQQFDPPGVGARDLAECLKIQLRQLPPETPWRAESLRLATDYLNLLGSKDFKSLMRRMRLREEQLADVVKLIQSLNPTPGDSLDLGDTDYIVPDVIVRKRSGEWTLTLNNDVVPELRINDVYSGMIKRADNSADNRFLKDHLQDARWFIKSLQSRNETLLKVSTEIISRQIGFLEQGEQAMKPLILHDIAEAVELHESTISRVTNRKYLHTPRGVFELKYFFSSQVATSDGSGASSTAIRAIIKKLISEEDPRKPLSDSKLATLLDKEGVNVARRTIAKYREVLNIPPSNERKRLV